MAAAAATRRSPGAVIFAAAALAMQPLICSLPAGAHERAGTRWGAVPISSFSSDLGYTLGVLAQRFDYGQALPAGIGTRPFQSLVTVQATHSTRGPKDLLLTYESYADRLQDPTSLRWYLDFYGMDTRFAHYYGLGPDSVRTPSLESDGFNLYDRALFSLEGALRKRVNAWGGMDLESGVRQTQTRAAAGEGINGDSQFTRDFGAAPESLTYSVIFVRGIWEKRDSEFIPTRGFYGQASINHSPLSGWSRLDLDYRRYFQILDERKLWLATQIRYGGSTPEAPLIEKARLGSLGTLRGVPGSRYISNHSASARAELRSMWFAHSVFGLPLKIGTGLYTDLGRVSETLAGLGNESNHAAWGVAFFGSYFTDDFLGSADFGFSREGSSVYLRLGHAF